MIPIVLGLLGMSTPDSAQSETGVQGGRRLSERAKRAQKSVPTVLGQPQPNSSNFTYALYDRRSQPPWYISHVGTTYRYNNWYRDGVNPVQYDPKELKPNEIEFLLKAPSFMPMVARGIPNQGLEPPHLDINKLEAYRSVPYLEPGLAEVYNIGDRKKLAIGMEWDRTTEMGPLHHPVESYSFGAMSDTNDAIMNAAGVPSFPLKTQRSHRENAKSLLEEAEAQYQAYRTVA